MGLSLIASPYDRRVVLYLEISTVIKCIPMRDRIRERLTEYRSEALGSGSIAIAENKTKSTFGQHGVVSSRMYLAINKDNETGFAKYMDRSGSFIRHVAPGSWAEYADELRDGGTKLKQEIMAKVKHELRGQLDPALDKLIKRKVEDFELGYVEGKNMNTTTHNTVNIINSNISNAVVQITQSGKDAVSKDTAQKLQEIINSEEIKGLPEETQLNVLDQADDVIKELSAPVTDKGKVYRGLKRLGSFISSVASKSVADVAAQLTVAYAKAHGIIP